MDRFRSLARKLIEAAALGLLVTALLYVPPASIAARLDAWLFDAWSRLGPPPPAAEIVLAQAESLDELARIAELAESAGAKLVVGTLADAPAVQNDRLVGPVEVPRDERRTRVTEWRRGGHLWLEPELDGVLRRDLPLLRQGRELPSLAAYASKLVDPSAGDAAERLLRLPRADNFPRLGALDVDQLAGRVVVAGPLDRTHLTPLGLAAAPELVAQMMTSHLGRHYVAASPYATAAAWLLALLVALPFAARGASSRLATLAWLPARATVLPSASALAFHALGVWLPAIGPTTFMLVTSALLTLRSAPPVRLHSADTDTLARARRATDDGRLKEAWALYRQLPASAALVPEMYDLACALAAHGAPDEAADLFHRVAQVDGEFRDVARRLVRADHAALDTDDRARMPSSIGRYQLLEPIGRGAMGNVYLGRDPLINRILALKAIDLAVGYDDEAELESTAESFLREAKIAGSLSHPNIVTIFDVGETDGLAYIAMEYVRGHHLSDFATPERLLPVETVLDLVSRAADALDYAHRRNVVHRDIKPANIMYDSLSNNLKITDFGIAKLIDANRTRTGIVLGTPAFMSPEQLEGKNVNGHTDLFALGVSLYQLLTGLLPFRGASMTNLMFVIANEPHQSVTSVRAELPSWLDEVLDRALAKNPNDRFKNAAEMAAALRRAA